MWFVVIGCALLAMKFGEFGFAAAWSWWANLLPFGLAVVWWAFSDSIGLTQRREMDKLDARKEERRQRQMDALGVNWRRNQRVAVIREQRKVEPPPEAAPKKTEQERHNRDVLTAFLPSRQEMPPQQGSAEKAGR
ncbi:MAG: TIGR04438 family Trp-rich protein [Burkholderiaceae bacterium]